MSLAKIVTLTLIVAAGIAGAHPAQAAATATLVGRLRFREAQRTVPAAEIERLRWGRVVLELRTGSQVFAARPDSNGMFTVAGPPGRYVIEYIRLGELAEFFVPHAVEAVGGQVTCLGTLEIAVPDLARDLGNNTSSELHVVDDCAAMAPQLQAVRAGTISATTPDGLRTSLARPAPQPGKPLSVLDVLLAFRAEVAFDGGNLMALRGDFVLPFAKDSSWLANAAVIHVSAASVDTRWPPGAPGSPAATSAWGAAVGAGYSLWLFEGLAYAGFLGDTRRGGHGGLVGGHLRFGTFLFGVGGRLDYYGTGDRVGTLTLDLSPVALLGSLL